VLWNKEKRVYKKKKSLRKRNNAALIKDTNIELQTEVKKINVGGRSLNITRFLDTRVLPACLDGRILWNWRRKKRVDRRHGAIIRLERGQQLAKNAEIRSRLRFATTREQLLEGGGG